MTSLAAPARDARFGLIVTIPGTLIFVPDALNIRLVQANTMDVAIWRGLFAALFAHMFWRWRRCSGKRT